MKKIFALLFALIMLVGLTACGPKRPTAKDSLDATLTAVQSADPASFSEYFPADFPADEAFLEISKALLASMTYEIGEVIEDGDTATAAVTFTNKDMSVVMSKLMDSFVAKAMEIALLPVEEQPTEEELNAMVMDEMLQLVQAETETVTITASASMIFADGAWDLDGDNAAFFDAMLGGMTTASEAFAA